jgi:hypothetical protein
LSACFFDEGDNGGTINSITGGLSGSGNGEANGDDAGNIGAELLISADKERCNYFAILRKFGILELIMFTFLFIFTIRIK